MKSIFNGETILFIGAHHEFNATTDEATNYYFAGAQRVAMRKYTIPQSMSVEYLLGDHPSAGLARRLVAAPAYPSPNPEYDASRI